jgi:hypothetical protein
MDYSTQECELDMRQGSMAGQAKPEGIGDRFDTAMDIKTPRLIQFNYSTADFAA